MENRTRIGFYYVWGKSWLGGLLYAWNLLKALNTLDDKDKPFIDVYCRNEKSFDELIMKSNYPYLNMVIINDNSLLQKVYRNIIEFLFGINAKVCVNRFDIRQDNVMVFPYGFGKETNKLVFWKPDFQEKYLTENFSKKEIKKRDSLIRSIAGRNVPIVFSSFDSESDFKKFYPEFNNKTFVVHFAVAHEDFSSIIIEDVKMKYGIKGDYILCANQFWKHKNHLFLFKAIKIAIKRGLNMQLVCTGRMSDYRNPTYIKELESFLVDNELDSEIILTGMIENDELYCLMKNAYAVIQPSLFEGWNTTVEDCKALNQFIYLSDIPVHREQAQVNVSFFDPHDENDLVEKLLTVKPTKDPFDYSNNLREFGMNFLQVINYMKSKN